MDSEISQKSSDCCDSRGASTNNNNASEKATQLPSDSMKSLMANECYRKKHSPYLTLLKQWQNSVRKQSLIECQKNIYLERISNLQRLTNDQCNEIDQLKITLMEKETEVSFFKRRYQSQNGFPKASSTSSSGSLNVHLSTCSSLSSTTGPSSTSLFPNSQSSDFLHPPSLGNLPSCSSSSSVLLPGSGTLQQLQAQSKQSERPFISTPNESENNSDYLSSKKIDLDSVSTIHSNCSEPHGFFLGEHISPKFNGITNNGGTVDIFSSINTGKIVDCSTDAVRKPIPSSLVTGSSASIQGATPMQIHLQPLHERIPSHVGSPLLFTTNTTNANNEEFEFQVNGPIPSVSGVSKRNEEYNAFNRPIESSSKGSLEPVPQSIQKQLQPVGNTHQREFCDDEQDFEALLNQTTASFLSAYPNNSLTWLIYSKKKKTERGSGQNKSHNEDDQDVTEHEEVRVPVRRPYSSFKIVRIKIEGTRKRSTYYKNFVARIAKETITPNGRRLFQIEYYRRKVEKVKGQLVDIFITAPLRQRYVCDEEEVVQDLPEPTKERRGKFVFDFNFEPFDIPNE